MSQSELVLRELVIVPSDDGGETRYYQEWYCPVPGDSEPYTVTAQDWLAEDGVPLRRIYETGPGRPGGHARG